MALNNDTLTDQYIVASLLNNTANYEQERSGATGAFAAGREMVARGIAPVVPQEIEGKTVNYTNLPKIAVINGDGVEIATERVLITATTTAGTTAFVNATRSTIQARFKVVPSSNGGNAVSLDAEMMARYKNAIAKMKKAADAVCVAAIDAGKTIYSAASFETPFNTTADEFQSIVPAGITKINEKKDVWLSAIDMINVNYERNEIEAGVVATIGSPSMRALLKYGERYGVANSENLSNIPEGQIFYTSSNITEGTETPRDYATMYNLLPYSFGAYTWVGSDAKQGYDAINGKTFTRPIPELGFEVEVLEKTEFADQTAYTGSYKAGVATEVRMAFDVITLVDYNSTPTTKASSIHKYKCIDNA